MSMMQSSWSASFASPAASKCPLWGGSKLPPRSPIRVDMIRLDGRRLPERQRRRAEGRGARDARADRRNRTILPVAIMRLRREFALVLDARDDGAAPDTDERCEKRDGRARILRAIGADRRRAKFRGGLVRHDIARMSDRVYDPHVGSSNRQNR